MGLDQHTIERFDQICRMKYPVGKLDALAEQLGSAEALSDLYELDRQLQAFGIGQWCEYDLGIVRGLAYYTGTVYEIHEISGAERAMAGGGRYDKLIESFGGPAMPAVGFGMGDVVLTNVLADKGLLPENVSPRPDVFVIAMSDLGAERLPGIVSELRQAGLHARFSYKTTRNLGRLMKDASASRAVNALILDDGVSKGVALVKNLESGEQQEVKVGGLVDFIAGK